MIKPVRISQETLLQFYFSNTLTGTANVQQFNDDAKCTNDEMSIEMKIHFCMLRILYNAERAKAVCD